MNIGEYFKIKRDINGTVKTYKRLEGETKYHITYEFDPFLKVKELENTILEREETIKGLKHLTDALPETIAHFHKKVSLVNKDPMNQLAVAYNGESVSQFAFTFYPESNKVKVFKWDEGTFMNVYKDFNVTDFEHGVVVLTQQIHKYGLKEIVNLDIQGE